MLDKRYQNGNDFYSKIGFLIQKNKSGIEKLKIPANAKFIVAPDLTKNGAFLFLNRMGWKFEKTEDLNEQNISTLKGLGATYLLLANNDKQAVEICNTSGKLI
jgi:hypothetical protein